MDTITGMDGADTPAGGIGDAVIDVSYGPVTTQGRLATTAIQWDLHSCKRIEYSDLA